MIVSEDTKLGQLAVFSEDILKELVSSAGLGHIDAVLQPVLMYVSTNSGIYCKRLDLHNQAKHSWQSRNHYMLLNLNYVVYCVISYLHIIIFVLCY